MNAVIFMALSGIRPIGNPNLSFRPWDKINATEPRIRSKCEIGLVPGDIGTARRLKPLAVDPPAMQIERENIPAVLIGPLVLLVDQQPDMGMPASGSVRLRGKLFANITPGLFGIPVHMIRNLRHQLIPVRIEISSIHSLKVGTRHGMPKMADDRIDEKQLTVPGPIHSPRISGSSCHHLETVRFGMISPNSAIQRNSTLTRCPGTTDERTSKNPVTPIKPTVGSPSQPVDHIVANRVFIPAIKDHDRFTVKPIIPIAVG